MRLDGEELGALRRALMALCEGSGQRFQDLLWLGFGDRWTLIEAALIQHGHVVASGGERRPIGIGESGRALLEQLASESPRMPRESGRDPNFSRIPGVEMGPRSGS